MRLSIVSTLYQSAPYLDEFLERMRLSAQQITSDYELILVNDGSPDHSLQIALAAQQLNSHIKVIDLSRNFGHHQAGMVGLDAAQGDYTFLIDCDLEEAPELILEFWHLLHQQPDVDVIYGVQKQRQGSKAKQFLGNLFYSLFNMLSDIKISPNLLTVRLMKKTFVEALKQYPEKNLFVAGIMAHAGFNQQALSVTKKTKPSSTYTLARQVKLFLVCITSFSSKPLEYCLIMVGVVMFFALLLLFYFLTQTLFFDQTISTLQAISFATTIIIGSVLTCTGLLGLYIASISNEVKNRPRAMIKTIYSKLDS